MKYFLINGAVHAYESDGSQDHLIPADAEPISESQAIELANPPLTVEQRREAVWEAVKSERKSRVNGGVLVSGHWYHTDVDSRVQHMRLADKAAALLAGGGVGADVLQVAGQPIAWKTLANDVVPMTAALAVAIVDAIEVLDALAFARAETLRTQIETSSDPDSIDITTGWPSTYAVRNINTGTYDELLDIQGIGPVITQAIIDGRPWASVSDLISIPAVDQTLLDVLAPHLSV
jgi:DNA uptake protein ComE-like DNA-binding protein